MKGNSKKGVGLLWLIPIGMFGFGFLMVPFYSVFCDWTGLNGRLANVATDLDSIDATKIDESRWVTVEFVASLNQNMPWKFRPSIAKMEVQPGKLYNTHFIAENQSGRDMVGRAVANVSPGLAKHYFQKTECFCFMEQTMIKDEKRDMALRFRLDPDLPKKYDTVTLSYTFFEVPNYHEKKRRN